MTLALQRATKLVKKLLYANCLTNGDWRNHRNIEVWLPEGASYVRSHLVRLVGDGLIQIFAASLFRTWPSHRFIGAGEALSEFLGLEFCHGVNHKAWALFAATARAMLGVSIQTRFDSAVARLRASSNTDAAQMLLGGAARGMLAADTHVDGDGASAGGELPTADDLKRLEHSQKVEKVCQHFKNPDWFAEATITLQMLECLQKYQLAHGEQNGAKWEM